MAAESLLDHRLAHVFSMRALSGDSSIKNRQLRSYFSSDDGGSERVAHLGHTADESHVGYDGNSPYGACIVVFGFTLPTMVYQIWATLGLGSSR